MIQLDHIALKLSDQLSHPGKLTGLIRQQYRDSKNTVSLDQSKLYYRRHGDDIHISAA